METLKTRLKECRLEAGISQEELARRARLKNQSIIGALESGSRKTSSYIPAIAVALGVESLWLAEGRGQKRRDGGEPETVDLEFHSDLFPVKRYNVVASCGIAGCAIEFHEAEKELPIFFRRDWIARGGYKPENLAALKVTGNSMEPNLWDGDLVVINRADVTPKNGAVFAANHEGECIIKRLRRGAERWQLESDNPDKCRHPAEPCTERTILIGRVVYKQSEVI
ncbi:transcriptional regulator [Betaproteobacteria bacterium]|nr:transcriptional regulator [Betaproteobacteria bacterium]GHU46028.1 transcriptional regulator [Betaproteobacteria bacterium]